MTEAPYENDPLRVSEAEEHDILNSSPRGTYAVLVVYAILFALLWLYFWFGLFLPAGPVR
jgi:hypothetical protein